VGTAGKDGANGKDAPQDAATQAQLADTSATLSEATNRLSSRLDGMQQQIDRNDKRAKAGISSAAALAMLPQASDPNTNVITAGAASYGGEAGLALGMSNRNAAGDRVIKGGLSVDTRGGVAVGIGAAWKF
jgi:autotransporter adhesin